jgi:hypothetical protein
MKLEKELIRFVCLMSWSIDPWRLWKLTPEQSALCIIKLAQCAKKLLGALAGS